MGSQLSDQEMDALTERLSDKLIEKVHEKRHNFWIEPETHYQEHTRWRGFNDDDIHSMKDLVRAYRSARGLFWKAFIGFAILGALVLTALGMGFKG